MLWKIILFIIIGVAGGVIGGMGMGGGTLLIPLLTLFTGTDQHLAQAVNLIAFIPMSLVALIIHMKNKLVEFKHVLITAIPAVAASVAAALISRRVNGDALSVYFGMFLMALGVYQLVCTVIVFIKNKREKDSKGDGRDESGEIRQD